MTTRRLICLCIGAVVLCTGAVAIEGCGGGGGGATDGGTGGATDHGNIVLKNRFGDPILVGSDEPYSPRQTCGACHDVDTIANGYHFQQGRTNAAGSIQTQDDFFADGRTWLKSDGMYGKW